jgi:hypothetical protein
VPHGLNDVGVSEMKFSTYRVKLSPVEESQFSVALLLDKVPELGEHRCVSVGLLKSLPDL